MYYLGIVASVVIATAVWIIVVTVRDAVRMLQHAKTTRRVYDEMDLD